MLGAELMFHFGNVAILTALVALFVLWRYRVAVLHGMQMSSGAVVPVADSAITGSVADNVAIDNASRSDEQPGRSPALAAALSWETRAQRRLTLVYLLSVGIPALALSALYLAQSGMAILPAYYAALTCITLSAAVPMIAVSLATPFWRAVLYWFMLLLAGVTVSLILALVQRAMAGKAPTMQVFTLVWSFGQLTVSNLWQPFILLLATGGKKLRGIAPITFAGLLVFGLAPLAGSKLTQALASSESGSPWVLSLGMNAAFIALALPVGWLAWWRLRTLARQYERKRFSDAQLVSRTWWLIFVAVTALELIVAEPRPFASLAGCVLVYAIFPPLNRFFLARSGLQQGHPLPRTLLVLRVFGYQSRTERLFDRVIARWRLFGPVTLIAAPDVIARTVDPAEFLRFVTGNVAEVFVQSQADLDARLHELDLAPDPDGRYRINEFCCRDNTWQATIVALMQRADAVIMDVRGVTAERHGCEFELRQLAARLPARKVVLIVDRTTDRAVIEGATAQCQAAFPMVAVERNSHRATDAVFEALLEAAA